MQTNNLVIKQINKCLTCRIGVQTILGYRDVYNTKCDVTKDTFTEEDIDDCDKESIEEISSALNIEGSIIEKYKILKRLSTSHFFDEEKDGTCLTSLQRIICALRSIYKEDDNSVTERHHYLVNVLRKMDELNNETIKNYNLEKSIKAFKIFDTRTKTIDEDKDDTHEIAKAVRYIFSEFCVNMNPKYEVEEGRNCGSHLFLEMVEERESIPASKSKIFFQKVSNLPEESGNIFYSFLEKAPKKFGHNLRCVMNEQGMTHQDIAKLINVRTNVIQAWEECDIPQQEESIITKLCRALLVSKEVLYRGTGKIYGNWKPYLESETAKIIKEKLEEKSKDLAKNVVRREIQEFIEADENEFQRIMQDTPQVFCEEDFNVFESREEMFESLLHKEEAYTLLEVLENRA